MIHPTACIEGEVGENTAIGAFVWIGPHVRVGRDCVIQAGARIGQHGFGYENVGGHWVPKEHNYGVLIGDDVHIGAGACIDRGSYRNTVVCGGARIDNLVHVAHNVVIGEDCIIVAGAEVSGSVVVGRGAWIAPNACVKEHITIGAGAVIGLGAVVIRDVDPDTTVVGNPARVLDSEGVA